nr:unnamed protein product [Callosobruchus chinensis]
MSSSSSPEIVRNKLLWEDSSDDSEDTKGEYVIGRAPRNFRPRVNHFTRWNDEEFRRRFRLSKETVMVLEQRLHNTIAPKTDVPMLQTAADFAGINESTTCQIVKKVIHAIASLAPEYIKMPNTQQQVDQVEEDSIVLQDFLL